MSTHKIRNEVTVMHVFPDCGKSEVFTSPSFFQNKGVNVDYDHKDDRL